MALINLGCLAFRRPFGPLEVAAWDALLQAIALQPLDVDNAEVSLSWCLETSGRFLTKSVYQVIATSMAPEPFSLIWASASP